MFWSRCVPSFYNCPFLVIVGHIIFYITCVRNAIGILIYKRNIYVYAIGRDRYVKEYFLFLSLFLARADLTVYVVYIKCSITFTSLV